MSEGGCTVIKVPDAAMPADFLTKWLGAAKLNKSIAMPPTLGPVSEPDPTVPPAPSAIESRRAAESGEGSRS